MPEIKRSGVSGCCVGGYFYDLGGAHSKYRSKTLEEFAFKMIDLGHQTMNFAMTNASQGTERKYLEALGFTQAHHYGTMWAHIVDGPTLDKHLQPFKLVKAQRMREEQERKRKEEEEKQKKIREQQEKERIERVAREEKELKALKLEKIESNDDVTMKWIQETYNKYPSISIQTLFNTLFGFKQIPNYERKWDDDALLRSINSRLRKRRELNVSNEPVLEKKKRATKK